jgi:hypothetical protein
MRLRFRPSVDCLDGRDVPTPTLTTLLSYPDPSVYGEPVTFTALVSAVFSGVYRLGLWL